VSRAVAVYKERIIRLKSEFSRQWLASYLLKSAKATWPVTNGCLKALQTGTLLTLVKLLT